MKSVFYRLDTCVWEITRKCNFRCAYCGTRAGAQAPEELNTEKCLDIAKQLADINCRRVVLIGGEIFLKDGWQSVCAALVQSGINTSIITNGSLINPALCDDIRRTGVRHICLSIDGYGEIHDKYRMKGSFEKACAAIELLKSQGFFVSVVSTLNSESVKTVDALYDCLCNLGVDAWQLQACSPFGNAEDRYELVISKSDAEFVTKFAFEKRKESKLKILVADNIGYYSDYEQGVRLCDGASFSGCGAGINTVGIDSVGNVKGCESLYDDEFVEGNLLEKSLEEIWNAPDAFSYNRKFTPDMLTGKCAGCDKMERCAGGCRSFNFFYHKKMYESPLCFKYR